MNAEENSSMELNKAVSQSKISPPKFKALFLIHFDTVVFRVKPDSSYKKCNGHVSADPLEPAMIPCMVFLK